MHEHVEPAVRLGQLIRQTRQSKNLSLRRLSAMSGIPYRTIDRVEHGEIARPRPDLLTSLAKTLSIPLADLYAIVHYSSPHDLPAFEPYMRARYQDFSPSAIAELTRYFENLANRDGVRMDGPPNGEDESQ